MTGEPYLSIIKIPNSVQGSTDQALHIARNDEGIVPDIKIKTRQKDIATGNDPVLKYIRKRLKSRF